MSSKYGSLIGLILISTLFLASESYAASTYTVKEGAAEKTPASSSSLVPIAEKNIFSPERKDFPATDTGMAQIKKPIARPQIVLYGVTIVEDYQSATIVNPGRVLRKGERESLTIKIGDKIGEYKLAKIFPDRITMESNGDNFEVLLYDSRNPKKRVETKTETKPPDGRTPPPTPSVPSEASVEIPKEPARERVAPSPPIQFTGNNLPSLVFSRQERSALISQRNASQK